MERIRFYILLTFLFVGILGINADIFNEETFHFLGKENGLAGESVSGIMVDHRGRMWITTNDGVSMYNGKRTVTYKVSRNGEHPNYVYDITESNDHTIYICTAQGVFAKGKNDHGFSLVHEEISRAETIFTHADKLYVGNRDGMTVCNADGTTSTVVVGASRMGVENGVRDITADDNGVIWFISRYAINSYFSKTGKYKSYVITPQMPKGAALSSLAICDGKFFIGTKNNGLYVYDLKSDRVRAIDGVGNIITHLNTTDDDELTVSCDGGGAFLIDTKTERVKEIFNTNGDNLHCLPTDAVYCYLKDRNGVNWFGFYRFGLCHNYHYSNLFHCYSFGGFTTRGLSVRSFYIGDSVKLIGAHNGLFYVEEKKNIVRHITTDKLYGASIFTNITFFKGKYYIGTYDVGLLVLSPETFTVHRIPDELLLTTTTIAAMAQNGDHLWIGTGEGIFVIDGERCVMRYTENNSRLCGGQVSGLKFDNNGNCWACSQGVSLYVAGTRTFENSNFPKGFFNDKQGLVCASGHDGKTYFFKQTNIFYTNSNMTDFGQLTLPKELQNISGYAFVDDQKGHFWYATDNGLYRTDYNLDNLQHFGYGEGLMCQFISVNGLHFDSDSNVWLATSNGLMRVDSNALETWQKDNRYHIYLYDIRKGSDLLGDGNEEKVNSGQRISLDWNFTSSKLAFKLILQDYSRQLGRLYQYKLGDEDEWRSVKDGSEVELSGLMLGIHSLKVRLAGAPSTEKTYEIVVTPSVFAIIELLLLVVVVVLLFMWRRYHNDTKILLDERNEIEGALIEVEQQNAEMQVRQEVEADPQTTQAKYTRVKINEQECAEVVERMKAYISKTECYTNPELKMSELAEVLGLSSSKLSQVFSLYLKDNYYEFINRYRLERFKQLIANGEYKRYTLTALSEKCGFKKSSFFSTFRRVEGMTPTEYLKSQNIKI